MGRQLPSYKRVSPSFTGFSFTCYETVPTKLKKGFYLVLLGFPLYMKACVLRNSPNQVVKSFYLVLLGFPSSTRTHILWDGAFQDIKGFYLVLLGFPCDIKACVL